MLDFLRNTLFTVLPWLVVLTTVVVVHELGHFLMAKAFGVAIDRFSIGFGKTLFSVRDRSGVEWRIAALPLGGYVRFAGDADASSSVPDAEDLADLRRQIETRMGPEAVGRYFHFKPLWQRALVVLAGPLANFVLATVIFTALTMSFGEPYQRPLIERVEPGTAAAAAGFQAGDEIVGFNGRKADNFFPIAEFIGQNANHPIHFEVRRAGRVLDLWATPAETTRPDMFGRPMRLGLLGVRAARPGPGQPLTRRLDPATALERGVERVYSTVSTTIHYVGRIFQGRESGNQIGGPIGTALLSKAVVQAGAASGHTWGDHAFGVALSILELIAFISVSIGFVNLLPIPMLDGGHLLFYGFEAVARRPLTAQFQAASYRVGLALVVGLMLFATWNDLQLPILKILGGRFS